jgi:HlyD family secretion protein
MVEEAEAALGNAEKRLQRERELFDDGLNSKRALDDAVAEQEQAAARLRANREALALAEEGFRAEDIAAAAATLAAAQARRDQAATQVDDTRLYAPSRGVIQVRAREPGAMVAVGEPVYTLSLTENVYVRAYVSERHLGQVQPGAEVTVSSDSGDRVYRGQVGFVSPRAEFTPKTVETPELRTDLVYRLRIVVEEPDARLRQGMPVTVQVESPGI